MGVLKLVKDVAVFALVAGGGGQVDARGEARFLSALLEDVVEVGEAFVEVLLTHGLIALEQIGAILSWLLHFFYFPNL